MLSIRLLVLGLAAVIPLTVAKAGPPLGLPDIPIPVDNPQSEAKVALGDKLFHDTRFSSTGQVSCATCHDKAKGLTDSPLKTSEGINKLTGTRNAPTVANSAYFKTQFWDGRSPSLEEQSLHPFVNPIEMGLPNHDPILKIVAEDSDYVKAFSEVFGTPAGQVTMDHVTKAIAAFERTQVFGNSPFDHYYFGHDKKAMSEEAVRGFQVFLGQGRCVSCHTIEQDHALFTDHRFHNVGVGINQVQEKVGEFVEIFLDSRARGAQVDMVVLSDKRASELGRFAVSESFDDIGGFKTPTLRNIALTAPYMHDGSLATLRDVVVHYNNGGVTEKNDKVNDFLSGGIRPLRLSQEQIDDLVAFMEALTSPELAQQQVGMTAAGDSQQLISRRQP